MQNKDTLTTGLQSTMISSHRRRRPNQLTKRRVHLKECSTSRIHCKTEVLTAVLMTFQVFRNIMPCRVVNSYRHIGEDLCLHLQGLCSPHHCHRPLKSFLNRKYFAHRFFNSLPESPASRTPQSTPGRHYI